MKKILCLFVLAAGLLLSGCKGGGEPQNKTTEVQLTPEGGVFNLSNGVTIVVLAGTVNEPTEIKVEYLTDLDETTGSLPSDIQGRLRLTPEGLTFAKPIEVSMPLNQPVAEQQTDIVWWSASDKTWYITDRGQVEGNKVKFYIEHFSDYASIGGGWGDLFKLMDAAVGAASTSEAISSALNNFLANTMWRDMGLEDFTWPTRAEMGGGAVSTCAQTCGIFAAWESQEGDNDRQGRALYKEQSTHNIITNIALSNAQMTSHLKSEYQTAADRIIEIYGEPCATELTGEASPAKIEKGKTATVTITATCDGSPLADQLIQLSYSPELSCDVVNKKTDANGQVTITVKGKEEGNGIVYAKAVNAINSDLVTEIQIPVKVGDGENWRITIDVQGRCYSAFSEKYNVPFYSTNYEYSGDKQEVKFAYTLIYDLTVQATGAARGTVSVTNYPEKFSYNAPAFSQSGDWIDQDAQIYSHAESSHAELSATPEYRTVKNVAVEGACYVDRKMASITLSDYGLSSMEEYDRFIHECSFLFPNASGSWIYQVDDDSDSGEYFLGKLSSMDDGKNIDGHYYRNYSHLCLPAYLFLENFCEMDETFEQTGVSYTGTSYEVTINGNEIELPALDNAVGNYTLYDAPAYWEGEVYTTLSGTLKIEQLTKDDE